MDETLESRGPRERAAAGPGERIGKYELVRIVGSGGMGMVWAARDPDLDREIALKLIRGADASAEQRMRFLREARAMARLTHPNVLTVYEVGTDADRDFIVMELVDGVSLDLWLRERPPAREVWDAVLAAGRGLAAAHEAGLVHRDFKPHNVLRSRDGRVLVTDFGLARGRGEVDALTSTVNAGAPEPAAADSVLDLQLTTTGQLLGTPAYMAPEQFAGDPPDPRTDQFAFCVTVWEALTGERPFRGSTLDELRDATRGGTSGSATFPGATKLPGAVRAVLVRGLAPERADRWPDVPGLLRALVRARGARIRRAAIALPIAVFAIVASGAAFVRHGDDQAAVGVPCVPGAQVLGTAWSPSVRADLLAHHPAMTDAAQVFDAYRTRWLAGYERACARPAGQRAVTVECYLSTRDELAVQVEIAQRFEASALGELEAWGVFAARDACAVADPPVFSPRLPDDARRPKIISLLARVYGNLASATLNVIEGQDGLRGEAKAIGWAPLDARVDAAIAAAAALIEQDGLAHRLYRHAADLAHAAGDLPEEARARIGVLETGQTDIGDELPARAYEDELRDAELAVHAAGDDPGQRAALDASRAAHAAYADTDLSGAIELAQRAYTASRDLHDVRRAAIVAEALCGYLSTRAAAGDLAHAAAIVAEIKAAVARSPFRDVVTSNRVRNAQYQVAWLQGDLATAHAALDVPGYPAPAGGSPRHGRVLDEAGRPVAGARVIAWRGELFGDAARLFTDVRFIPFATVTTDERGAFAITARDGGAIMAELGELRSVPVPARDTVELRLRPTHALSGTLDAGGDPAIGIEPFARIEVTPETAWFVSTAPAADGQFTIAGIPPARTVRLGAAGSAWPREIGRRIDAGVAIDRAVIRWPSGRSLDYSLKASRGTAWLLPGKVTATTRVDVERIARTLPDTAKVAIIPIGWRTTTLAGLGVYAVGQHHIVIRDNPVGDLTLCVSIDDSQAVRCVGSTNEGEPPPVLRDGRRWYGGEGANFEMQR